MALISIKSYGKLEGFRSLDIGRSPVIHYSAFSGLGHAKEVSDFPEFVSQSWIKVEAHCSNHIRHIRKRVEILDWINICSPDMSLKRLTGPSRVCNASRECMVDLNGDRQELIWDSRYSIYHATFKPLCMRSISVRQESAFWQLTLSSSFGYSLGSTLAVRN